MARKPNKKPHRKPPTINQRLKAQMKRAAASQALVGPALPRHKPDVRIDKAQRAWEQRRFDEAIWYYERALARDPQNPVLLVDVARAYALRYRYADSEKLVDLAQSLHPDDAHLQQMLGRSFVRIQQFDRAIACYQRSLELAPNASERPETLLELAKMHERLHDLAAARQCVEEAIALAPGFEKAKYSLANIERRAGDKSAAESRWRQLIDAGRAPPGVVADSWYQLAALYDGDGRYGEAFDALVRAKQIFSRAAAPYLEDARTIAHNAARTFNAITEEHCARWNAAGAELPPLAGGLALLTSHPRSGTTLLEQVLDSHPQLISADELQVLSELVFVPLVQTAAANEPLTAVLDRTGADFLNQLRRTYLNAMEGALREPIGNRMLLDKNPELTMLLPLVARVFPEMKILFALRDPRDVVVSCFMQRLPLNAVSVHYLTLEGTAKKYASSMRAWLKIRPMLRNPWTQVRYEDTVADMEHQARSVLDFLGLPWDDVVLEYHRRARKKHVHSPTYEAVTKPVYTSSVERWRNYAAQLEACLPILQPFVEEF
ncbi:MAG TPA: sulfotransferase, partial [Lacipirellulaceae bacterium]